jgi:aminoglycoside phosphotransferase (APT) family kinase protein
MARMTRPRMHVDEIETSVELARALLREQHPQWADLPIQPVTSAGTMHALYRLGEDLVVRLPLRPDAVREVAKEQRWLPTLAPHLPLAIPTPVASGAATEAHPYRWSVYRWVDGDSADRAPIEDSVGAARSLGRFAAALRRVDASGAPEPGPDTTYRGAPVAHRDAFVRAAIDELADEVDGPATSRAWDAALAVPDWDGDAVWFHGDLMPGNLLVRDGRLAAVIDFGCCGAGDPAVDAIAAWYVFRGEARATFRHELGFDDATWARGRGWALSGALLAIPYYAETNPAFADLGRRTLDAVLTDDD